MATLEISPLQLQQMILDGDPIQLVDVRSTDEYRRGHLAGALNVPLNELAGRIADLDRRGRVVLVCQGGLRAGMACAQLANQSIDTLRLNGGTDGWLREGLPIVTDGKSTWSLERQVRLAVGVLSILFATFALVWSANWAVLNAFIGVGLTYASITNRCALASTLNLMPWNQSK